MPKAYFIGGAPRVGKTTLSLSVIKERPMLGSSTDALRHVLREIVSEHDEPGLFAMEAKKSTGSPSLAPTNEGFNEVVQKQREECFIVWKSVMGFVESHLEDGIDVLIEGLAVLPEFIPELKFECSAVFIGNISDQHIRTTLNAAESNPRDWMGNYDPKTAESFCMFNQHFSRYIQTECEKYSQQYVEVDDGDFENSLNVAAQFLLKDKATG